MGEITGDMCVRSMRHLSERPYVTAGNRLYCVGTQDGGFPDLGEHIPGEMGGIWAHPIKVADGFWVGLLCERRGEHADSERRTFRWLGGARAFEVRPCSTQFELEDPTLGVTVTRQQFVPDDEPALVVRFVFRRLRGFVEALNNGLSRVWLYFAVRSDLRPVWSAERFGWRDYPDVAQVRDGTTLVFRDGSSPWFLAVASDRVGTIAEVPPVFEPPPTAGQGAAGALVIPLFLLLDRDPVDEVTVVLGASGTCEPEALDVLRRTLKTWPSLQEAKCARIEREVLGRTRLEIPDRVLAQTFDWVKVNLDWLVRSVPGVGTGLGAGIPEYPWWFGTDTAYSAFALVALGQFELAMRTLSLLSQASAKRWGVGRIPHEVITTGDVVHSGNTQETPHFVRAVAEVVRWSGDLEFARELYPACREGVEKWILGRLDADKDLLPEGQGIMEQPEMIHELIDSAVYLQGALEDLAFLSGLVGASGDGPRYLELAGRLREAIESRFWLEHEGLYADMLVPTGCGTPEERPELLKTWVILCPVEVGLAPVHRAVRVLSRMETEEFSGPWGLFLSGLTRRSVMTISNAVMAVAECQYDRMDQGLSYIQATARFRDVVMPGSIAEVLPDAGCFVQAWTAYAFAWPLVAQLGGVRPDATKRTIRWRPRLPRTWDRWGVRNLRIGSASFTFSVYLAGGSEDQTSWVYEVSSDDPSWTVELQLPGPTPPGPDGWEAVDGKEWRYRIKVARSATVVVKRAPRPMCVE